MLEASETPVFCPVTCMPMAKHVGILCVPGSVGWDKSWVIPLLKMDGQAVFEAGGGGAGKAAHAALAKSWFDGVGHRLADSAPGEHPHHAGHGPS